MCPKLRCARLYGSERGFRFQKGLRRGLVRDRDRILLQCVQMDCTRSHHCWSRMRSRRPIDSDSRATGNTVHITSFNDVFTPSSLFPGQVFSQMPAACEPGCPIDDERQPNTETDYKIPGFGSRDSVMQSTLSVWFTSELSQDHNVITSCYRHIDSKCVRFDVLMGRRKRNIAIAFIGILFVHFTCINWFFSNRLKYHRIA